MRFLETAAALVSLTSVVTGQGGDINGRSVGPGKGHAHKKPLISSEKLRAELTTEGYAFAF